MVAVPVTVSVAVAVAVVVLVDISCPDIVLPFQRLDVYVLAKELARRVHLARIRDSELRDQATRAAKSAFLCLAEGLPNDGPAMRRKYFVESNNSLHETVAAVDLAAAVGALGEAEAAAVQALGIA